MSRFLTAIFGLLFSGLVSAAQPLFIILKPSQGPELLDQCSRSAPEQVSGFWHPARHQIQELEAGLPGFISSHPNGKLVPPLSQFNRQYTGFIQGGKKYIYGNFFSASLIKSKYISNPVVVCDGGPSFWGVVYSIESKTFQELSFNGAI
jgi:hypothetical protein